MWRKRLPLLSAALMLTACATGTPPTVVAPTLTLKPVVPEALTLRCDPLPKAEDGKLGTLLKNHVETARLYHLCAQRHGDLVGVLRAAQDGTGK